MEQLQFTGKNGDFILHDAQRYPEVYFPLVNEGGMISSVTPNLAGDSKTGQNHFLLAPASMETLHESRATRNFWVCPEGEKPWSVTGQSVVQRAKLYEKDGESVTLEGGLLWQRITRRHKSLPLTAKTLSFVPAGRKRAEIMQVCLTNTGDTPLTLMPIAAIPLYGRSADNIRDHRQVTSLLHRVKVTAYGIDLHPTLTFDERGHRPGDAVYRIWGADGQGKGPEGVIPSVCDFVGCGSYDWPEAVVCPNAAERLLPGDKAEGKEAVGALFFSETTIRPGQTVSYQIVMAIDDDPTPFLTPEGVEKALAETKAYWQRAAGQRVCTSDSDFDAWCIWTAVQPLLRRICGCSFLPHHDYGRGGRGWRDLWQDSLALLLTDPAAVKEDLWLYFAGVRTDGTNATIIGTKPGEFKADRNNIPRVWMDHGFWPLFTVKLYLDESGDLDFLLREQSYFSDALTCRGEKISSARRIPEQGTVLEHLLIQHVTAFFDVGEHGFMRLRGADWNDGLDMARERGESVAFTAAYAGNFDTLAGWIDRLRDRGVEEYALAAPLAGLLVSEEKKPENMAALLTAYCEAMEDGGEKTAVSAELLRNRLKEMGRYLKAHIRESEWVGDGADLYWFNSYYDNTGRPVEGQFGDKIRMMLTGQVFCLLSGTATEEQAALMIRAADWYLYDATRGGYSLNTDFEEVKLDMGRMFGFAYGNKENGAVFCHMAVMYAYALYARGFAADGWRVLNQLYTQSVNFAQSRILPGIPEYFDRRGQGMYPYLTGAASWLMLLLQTQVFGVRGENGDLRIEPKLLREQFHAGACRIQCTCLGRPMTVLYENPLELDWGEYQIGRITCGEKSWVCEAEHALIPASELPRDPVTLTVELIICE